MEKLCYLQRKHKKRRRIVALTLFLILFLSIILYIFCIIIPVVKEATWASIYTLSTSAVSDAVYDVIAEQNLTYEDLVETTYDSNGNISLISVDTVLVNSLTRRFYQVAQVYLDRMGDNGIDIALGTFSGIPPLVGVGPKINIKLVQIGAMTASFRSSFQSAGINQTIHSLYIELHATVSLLLPAYSSTVDSITEVLVVESVIVGEVPDVYLGSNNTISLAPSDSM